MENASTALGLDLGNVVQALTIFGAEGAAGKAKGFDVTKVIDAFGYVIYGALAILAIWGVYNAVLLYRNLGKKGLKNDEAAALVNQVRDLTTKGNFQGAIELCSGPQYWHSALAQLISLALRVRDKGLAKVKQVLVMEFHTEVIAAMENRIASISTIVRMGPLLGLLGTVASMIGAFGRIGGGEKVDPKALAADISLALWATGSGLLIATPMMIVGNDIHAKLRHLRDMTERQLGDFIEILEAIEARDGRMTARSDKSRAVLH